VRETLGTPFHFRTYCGICPLVNQEQDSDQAQLENRVEQLRKANRWLLFLLAFCILGIVLETSNRDAIRKETHQRVIRLASRTDQVRTLAHEIDQTVQRFSSENWQDVLIDLQYHITLLTNEADAADSQAYRWKQELTAPTPYPDGP
jgi:hypothetical protein